MQTTSTNEITFSNFNLQPIEQIKHQPEEQQIQEKRGKIFFSPIEEYSNSIQTTEDTIIYSDIQNKSFYIQLEEANVKQLQTIFVAQLHKLIELDYFYCNANHVNNLNQFIERITNVIIDETILLRFKNINYWLYKLIILLKNFQFNQPNNMTLNKETIALRLEECFSELDKCWDGIGSRFAREYEILNSMQQGLIGEIHLIRIGLFQEVAIKYMAKLNQENKYKISISTETHDYGLLYNLMADILAFNSIPDYLINNNFPEDLQNKFIKLVKLEINPAKIVSILTAKIYNKLSSALAKISMEDWLVKNKTDDDLVTCIDELYTTVFTPINILYNAEKQNQLTINSIVDIIENNGKIEYSMQRAKEKLCYWVASTLINEEKVFIANIIDKKSNNLCSIATVDYMFFWVFAQENHEYKQQCKYDPNNHITLQLSHIQQLDFINLTNVNAIDHLSLFDDYKKTEVSTTLITQAMLQTNDPEDIINFFTDSNIQMQLSHDPELKNKIANIFYSKLTDETFKQEFITVMTSYILNNNIILISEQISWILESGILNKVSIAPLKKLVSPENKDYLFKYALDKNNCELLYKLLLTNYYDEYINSKNKYKKTLLAIALENKHQQLSRLLIQYSSKINFENELYAAFCRGNYHIYIEFIRYILANKNKFNRLVLNNLININRYDIITSIENTGIFVAINNSHSIAVKEYFEFILTSNELDISQKIGIIEGSLSFFMPEYKDDSFLFSVLHKSHYFTNVAKEYLNIILNLDGLNRSNKISILFAKDQYNNSLLHKNARDRHPYHYLTEYLNYICSSNIVNADDILEFIGAKNSHGSSALYIACCNNNEYVIKTIIDVILSNDKLVQHNVFELLQAKNATGNTGLAATLEISSIYDRHIINHYMESILNTNQLTIEQKLELIIAKNSVGKPALSVMLKKKYLPIEDNLITCYVKNILQSNTLTIGHKLEIIQAEYSSGSMKTIKISHDKYSHIEQNLWKTKADNVISYLFEKTLAEASDITNKLRMCYLLRNWHLYKEGVQYSVSQLI